MWPLSDHNGCGLPGILTSPLLRLRPRHKAFCSCNTRGSSYPVSNTTDALTQVRGNLEGAAIDPLTTAYVLPCAPKNTRSRKCSCNTHPSTASGTPETRLLMLLTPTTVRGEVVVVVCVLVSVFLQNNTKFTEAGKCCSSSRGTWVVF